MIGSVLFHLLSYLELYYQGLFLFHLNVLGKLLLRLKEHPKEGNTIKGLTNSKLY